jgi:Mg-chelatase subunit ChlD
MRHYTIRFLALFALTGCCAVGDCKDPELAVTAQAATVVAKPANVTVSFKVDDETGNGVANLKTDNFNIYEDDAAISSFEAKPVILPKPGRFSNYTIILLDLSGSITQSQSLPAVKTAATKFVQTVVPDPASADVQVALWWFDGAAQPHILVPFTASRIALTTAIASLDGSMSADNSTNLNGAMVAGIDSAFERAAVDKAKNITSIGSVVLFTDGTDQAARVTETTVRTKIANTRGVVRVYSIGLGREVSANVLDAYGPDGYFQASDPAALADKFTLAAQRVKDNANSYYQLQYCSPKRAGTHELRIEAVFDKARGSLRTTFNADGFGGGCTAG